MKRLQSLIRHLHSERLPPPSINKCSQSVVQDEWGFPDIEKKKVLVIHTGGTLGMVRNDKTKQLETKKGYLKDQLPKWLHIQDGLPQVTIEEWDELMDSSNMEPNDWIRLASQIEENYFKYDGFVILHGTDTLAYTSSALSFILQNLGKPVILTGSVVC